jgi:hypothetical protein
VKYLCNMQEEQIPALHVDAASLDTSAHPQQFQQDSLEVDASQWSQSRSARRKQKRKDHSVQSSPLNAGSTLSPLDAGSTLKCSVQPTKQLTAAFAATESTDADQNTAAIEQTDSRLADAAVAAASGAQPLHAKQRSKRPSSRAASPLGKKKDAGGRGQGSNRISLHGRSKSQAGGEDVEAIQIAMQEEAEMQIMVRPQLTRFIIVRTVCYQPVQITVTSLLTHALHPAGPYSCASSIDPSLTFTTWYL